MHITIQESINAKTKLIISTIALFITLASFGLNKYDFIVRQDKVLHSDTGLLLTICKHTVFFPIKSLSDSSYNYLPYLMSGKLEGFYIEFPKWEGDEKYEKYYQLLKVTNKPCLRKGYAKLLPVHLEYTKEDLFSGVGLPKHRVRTVRDTIIEEGKPIVFRCKEAMYKTKSVEMWLRQENIQRLDSIWTAKGYSEPKPSWEW